MDSVRENINILKDFFGLHYNQKTPNRNEIKLNLEKNVTF